MFLFCFGFVLFSFWFFVCFPVRQRKKAADYSGGSLEFQLLGVGKALSFHPSLFGRLKKKSSICFDFLF